MISKYRKFLDSENFISNVVTLMFGSIIAQSIPLIISPILTRLYTPADFGLFALYISITQIVAVIAAGRYEYAIMLPKQDNAAFNLLSLSLIIAVAISAISCIIFILFNNAITNIAGNPDLSYWLYVVPLSILLFGAFQVFTQWLNRLKLYQAIATSRIVQSVITGLIHLGLGYTRGGGGGLILGSIIGQGSALGFLVRKTIKKSKEKIKEIHYHDMIEQAGIYSDFPKINSLHAFVDILQSSGTIFIISALFDSTIVGFYALTLRVLRTPLNFIGKAVSQVFYQRASEKRNKEEDLRTFIKKTVFHLSIVSLPVFIILIIFAPQMFALVFGKEWHEAGKYTQILAFWLSINFIYSPISQIPLIVNKQKEYLLIGISYNLIIILSFVYAGTITNDIYTALYLLAILMPVFLIFLILWLYKIAKQTDRGYSEI